MVSEPVHYKLLQSIATTRNQQRWGPRTLEELLEPQCLHRRFADSSIYRMLVSSSCRGACRHNRRHWTQQLPDRPFHRAVHFRNHCWDIALIYVSYLRNGVGPNGQPRSEICHLGGDCDFDLDATRVVDFLELLQSSAKHILDIGATVVGLDSGKVSAGAKPLDY